MSVCTQPQDRLASSFSTLNLNNGGDLQSRRFSLAPHQVTAQKVALKATAAPKKSVTRSAYPRGPIRVDSRQMERRLRIQDAALSLWSVSTKSVLVSKSFQAIAQDLHGLSTRAEASIFIAQSRVMPATTGSKSFITSPVIGGESIEGLIHL